MQRILFSLAALLLTLATVAVPARAQEVDLLLVLAFDCSYSVDTVEFELQKNGMSQAFTDPDVLDTIAKGPNGRIAVTIIQWSSWESQILGLDWTIIDSPASGAAFAAAIQAMPRMTLEGATSASGAIYSSIQHLSTAPFLAFRKVIDVSGDGRNNNGPPLSTARDLAVAQGITVNGLAILNEIPTLHYYYEQQMIGGPGAFVETANTYRDYPEAIRRKLLREISILPVSKAPLPAPDESPQVSDLVTPPTEDAGVAR